MVELPPEIIDQIVGQYQEPQGFGLPDRYDHPSSLLLKHSNSKALLACHKVSRQFRACTLRYICQTISLSLYDPPKSLRALQDIIFKEVNPQFGSLASFVTGVHITIVHRSIPLPRKLLKVHREAVLQVLNMIANRITIQKLSISGREHAWRDWTFLPLAVRNALESLLRLPSVSSLHLQYIGRLPAQFLATNAHLKSLSIANCWKMRNLSSFSASLPELERITMRHMEQFPEGIKLPSLRTVNVQHSDLRELNTIWGVIQRASESEKLRKIIYNGFDLPPSSNIASFLTLESFVYSPELMLSPFSMQQGIRFVDASRPVPNIQAVTLSYRLYPHEAYDITGFDHAWKELDRVFTGGHYTGLQKLYINIKMPLSLWRSGDDESCSPAELAQAHVLNLFCESRKRSLPIEVDVTTFQF